MRLTPPPLQTASRKSWLRRVGLAGLTVALLLATAGAALVANQNVGNQSLSDDAFTRVHVFNATLERGSINHTSIHDSSLKEFAVQDATLRRSHVAESSLTRVLVEDSRLQNVGLRDATLQDVTLCNGVCQLVSGSASGDDQSLKVHARLVHDAPTTLAPGESYDLKVVASKATTLMVRNDPAGVTEFGFDNAAADSAIASLELLAKGDTTTFAMGESIALPRGQFTVRVNVAETGIIDGSTLGLVLELDGHGLRPATSTLQVVATELAFAPMEQQAFAPYLSDNVARLVMTVGTDANGNVDRDLDIAYTLNVTDVQTPSDVRLVGNRQHHAFLHGDSELFSTEPFKYSNPTSLEAHHPATLELILRDNVGLPGITYGVANFHATHLVTQSPYPATVELTAATTTSAGMQLSAGPYLVELGPLPADDRSASTPFGPLGDPMFPGTGMLRVHFVDADGAPVEPQDGWSLMVQETPDSHQVEMRVALAGKGSTFDQPLAASPAVGLPFGDFVPHEYLVCLHAGGEPICANNGDLIAIRTGSVTEVWITVA